MGAQRSAGQSEEAVGSVEHRMSIFSDPSLRLLLYPVHKSPGDVDKGMVQGRSFWVGTVVFAVKEEKRVEDCGFG
jgi:hypothetical protein